MSQDYAPPQLDKNAFNCPHCDAFAAMAWNNLQTLRTFKWLKVASCHRCNKDSVWLYDESGNGKMLYPQAASAPFPNEDLPSECMKDYLEARTISESSPRGAAALLRLCIQKLCVYLGGEGKNINDDIAHLVQNGLPVRVQQALDVVRVVGNNAVHPGEISVEEQPGVVLALFGLINLIVENQISQPKHVAELFSGLPDGAKVAVEKRDRKA